MTYAAAFCCAVLAFFDVRSGKIPNAGILIFSLAGLIMSCVSYGPAGLADSLCGAGGMFLILWVLYVLRLMGAGDVKLLMMLGVFAGWPDVLYVFAASIAAGSVYAAARLLAGGNAGKRFLKLAAYLSDVRSGRRPASYIAGAEKEARVSFAVFAFLGTLICAAVRII